MILLISPINAIPKPWHVNGLFPGQEGLRHHVGGLEKADITGEISYDPFNHEKMTIYRTEKIARVANDIPCSR